MSYPDSVDSREPKVENEIPIDGRELVAILHSDKFERVFWRKHRQMIEAEGLEEVGFDYMRRLRSPVCYISHSTLIMPRSVGFTLEGAGRYERKMEREKFFPLFRCHFHPPEAPDSQAYDAYAYIPSKEDLSVLQDRRKDTQSSLDYDSFPIMIIATPQGREKAKLLLIQETPFAPQSEELLGGYEKDIKYCRGEEEILQALREWGYEAAFLTYTKKEGLSPEGKLVLQSFGFSLKKLPEKIEENQWDLED